MELSIHRPNEPLLLLLALCFQDTAAVVIPLFGHYVKSDLQPGTLAWKPELDALTSRPRSAD